MSRKTFTYVACAVAILAVIVFSMCFARQSSRADAQSAEALSDAREYVFENVSDRPMTKKDIAEKKAAEEAAARKAAEEAEAKRKEEERRLEEERKAQQAAAEEAERAAEEAARKAAEEASLPSVSYSPGEGEYGDTLLIGDSIMVVSSWSIESYMPGVVIDACSARSLENGGAAEGYAEGDGVLDHVRALDPNMFSRYVIGTGNNDWAGMDMDSGEEIVSHLAGKQIWFVTEYVTNNESGTDNTNATIDELCAKYPNVHKIDWHALASANREAFLGGDNCHPQNQEATDAYAGLVKAALDAR